MANLRLTNRCNIRCIHCYYNSPLLDKPNLPSLRRARQKGEDLPDDRYLREMMKKEVDSDVIRALAGQLLRMGVRRFQFGGNGEPFLYKDILSLIGMVKYAGSQCRANTNGTLLDRGTIDELIKLKFDDLRITTMAGTDDTYFYTHPGISNKAFSTLKQNLLYLAGQKAILRVGKPEITLVFIVVSQNVDDVFAFAEFAHSVGADQAHYRPVDDIEDAGLKKLLPDGEQVSRVHEQLDDAKDFLESRGIGHNIDYFKKIFREQLNTEELYRVIPCYYGWLSTTIDVDGAVYPCCRCYEPLGNINEKGFDAIWNGKSYRRFRKDALLLNRRREPVEGCDCYSCVHHTANLKAYRKLHPVKGRSQRLKNFFDLVRKQEENHS